MPLPRGLPEGRQLQVHPAFPAGFGLVFIFGLALRAFHIATLLALGSGQWAQVSEHRAPSAVHKLFATLSRVCMVLINSDIPLSFRLFGPSDSAFCGVG